MQQRPLYTIGHGTRKAEAFAALLQQEGIRYLADVRSVPYSRFHPQFNQKNLEAFLARHGITYIYMGDTLGGRPKDPSCYDASGRINYDALRTQPFFLSGISRLQTAYNKNLGVAIMCSESNPARCHRTHLIAKALVELGLEVRHIDEKGRTITHTDLQNRERKPPAPPMLL